MSLSPISVPPTPSEPLRATAASAAALPTATASATVTDARPFLKWAGGKSQLLTEIRARVPAALRDGRFTGTYHEPFLGGGAVFFSLRPRRARLTDMNAELINAYHAVRDDVEGLIGLLAQAAPHTDHDTYYRVRDEPRPNVSPTHRAARLIYLNKTCYNGLYRVNRNGRFNVPYGRYKRPTVCDAANLRACSAALSGVLLETAPYDQVCKTAIAGDFVYFDPPYQPVSATANFTGYYRDGFDEAHQRRLAEVFAELHRRGCGVLLSNSDAPLIRELYARFRIEQVAARRAINSHPDKRGRVFELLVSNAV